MNQRGILGISLAGGIGYAVAAVAIAALLTGIYLAIYNRGYAAGKQLLTDYQSAQVVATVETVREVEKVVIEVQTKYVDRVRVVREKGNVIVQKVPEYITVSDNAACDLRMGFVRMHDSAASNDPPTAPDDIDRTSGGVTLAEAAATVSENYAQAHVWRSQVIGWQEFWTRYSETMRAAVCLPK